MIQSLKYITAANAYVVQPISRCYLNETKYVGTPFKQKQPRFICLKTVS